MVFLKRSTTALLALILLSLASTVFTSKAQAKEVSAKQTCSLEQFLVLAPSECKPQAQKAKKSQDFLVAVRLAPTPQVTEKPQTEEKRDTAQEQTTTFSATPSATFTPTPTATLSADVLFDMVNSYRKSINLPAFEHDSQVCSVAESRREEISQEIFVSHQMHAGFYAKNLPYWATENMIWQHTEGEALNWWLHSPVHKAAIEGAYKYACGVCNGEVCNMVFTSYEQKITATGSAQLAQVTQQPTPIQQPSPSVKTTSDKLVSLGLGLKN